MELPDDTVNSTDVSGEPESKKGTKKEEPARPYLKSFETLPATSLNAYSQAQYGDVDNATMWKELSKALPTGGMWTTELCSQDNPRQGIALNRATDALQKINEHTKSAPTRST